MRIATSIGLLASLGMLAGPAAASTLYSVDFGGPGSGELYTVNQSTGAITSVGNTGNTNLGDLTSDNASRLWTIDLARNNLLRLDQSNASILTTTGITGTAGPIVSLAFNAATNTMFGNTTQFYSGSQSLYTIDVSTGAATLVGNLTQPEVYGLGVDNAGTLFGWGNNGVLYSINTGTAAMTTIGTTTGNGSMFDLAARPEDNVMFASNAFQSRLETVDTGTGGVTIVGPYGSTANVVGLAFLDADVPEPASFALLGAGLLGLGLLRRRK